MGEDWLLHPLQGATWVLNGSRWCRFANHRLQACSASGAKMMNASTRGTLYEEEA